MKGFSRGLWGEIFALSPEGALLSLPLFPPQALSSNCPTFPLPAPPKGGGKVWPRGICQPSCNLREDVYTQDRDGQTTLQPAIPEAVFICETILFPESQLVGFTVTCMKALPDKAAWSGMGTGPPRSWCGTQRREMRTKTPQNALQLE